ncbi:MAG: argonaute/piwi family protein [Candidatus Helarchaeota archaeon]
MTSDTLKTDDATTFLVNIVPLKIHWNSEWQIYEIEIDAWDKQEDYDAIRDFKSSFQLRDVLLESHGRLLVVIPQNKKTISDEVQDVIKKALKQKLGKATHLKLLEDPLIHVKNDDMILNAVRKGVGKIISSQLITLGFTKVESGGGVGEFLPPEDWQGEPHQVEMSTYTMYKAFRLSIIAKLETNSFFLAADIKGRYKEMQNLLDWIQNNMQDGELPQKVNGKDKIWQIPYNIEIEPVLPNEIEQESFEIQGFISWTEAQEIGLGWGKHTRATLKELRDKGVLPEEVIDEPVAIVKPLGKIIKDPNIELFLPVRFFYRHLSQPGFKDKRVASEFKKFTLISPQKRYQLISAFFKLLEKNNLAEPQIIAKSYKIEYAKPGVRGRTTRDFGRPPQLNEWGVESWGDLRKIDIFFNEEKIYRNKIKNFLEILQEQISTLLNASKLNQNTVEVNLSPIKGNKFHFNKILEDLDKTCCPIFIIDNRGGIYKTIKRKITQENGIPVQVIKEPTIIRSRNFYSLIRTLLPQIIAKTGGLPYKLSPPLLDQALLIGLDKARDSSGRRPSASAGIAAVTPEGYYVSGASTPLERNTTDFINVDKLAPELLQELEEKKFGNNYNYVVILRDGSPRTCINEVPQWRKHLQAYEKDFIFLASRKTHAFRIFPSDIKESTSRLNYEIPLILAGHPLPQSDFLVLSARSPRGTPMPVLYTIMENTTSLSDIDIKNKVIPQIVSMSMLCWESPSPTSQPLPLHYADKLANFTQLVQQAWNSSNRYPMFI